jgi:hypothetical protein
MPYLFLLCASLFRLALRKETRRAKLFLCNRAEQAWYNQGVATENIEQIYLQVAANIRALRRRQRIKVKDIADLLGFAEVSSFYQIEQCRVRISLYHLLLLADLFGVSLQTMLSEKCADPVEDAVDIKDGPWQEF